MNRKSVAGLPTATSIATGIWICSSPPTTAPPIYIATIKPAGIGASDFAWRNKIQSGRYWRHSARLGGMTQSRLVKGGSSYLSQSELPVTFGLEKRDRIERVVIDWPSGQTEEYKNLAAGRCYRCTRAKV